MASQEVPSWEGVPEVICHNATPREIGLAHGKIGAPRIRVAIANYTALYAETANCTWGQSRAHAEKYVDPLKRHVPEIVEEMQAIAEASELDFLDIVTLNVRSEISLTNYSDGCTTVGQHWVKGQQEKVFLSQNWDWVGEAGNHTIFLDIQRVGGPRIRMFGEAGLVGKFGFNSEGVGMCMNAIRSGFVNQNMLPVHIAIRKGLECSSYEEVLKMLNDRGVASCVNFAIADAGGSLGTVECSPLGNTVISPDEEGTIYHTNHLWAPNLPQRLVDHPSKNSFTRLARIQELSKGQAPSYQSIRSRMSDEENSPTAICRSTPPGAKGMERMITLATIITDLKNRRAEVSLGRPVLNPPVRILTA